MAEKSRNIVIDWSDVKDQYIASVERGERMSSQPVMNSKLMKWHSDPYLDKKKTEREREIARLKATYGDRWKRFDYNRGMVDDDWEGGSPADTLKYLREGFHAPEFAHSAEFVPIAEKIRSVWNDEEGDVDPGRLLSGRDDFFLGAQKRLAKPGLRIQIEFAFAWTVSSKTIQEYGAWCAGLIGALEASGFDLTVDMWIPLDYLYEEDGYGGKSGITRTNVLVRVKRANEVSDFTEWSSLFGPTGYRHLGFLSKAVAGQKKGLTITGSFGMTVGGKTWGVKYDPEKALCQITCNQRAGGSEKFPYQKLNQQAVEQGLLPELGNFKRKER